MLGRSISKNIKAVIFFGLVALTLSIVAGEFLDLPPAHEYGNLLIDRTSSRNSIKPATFSHWIHRRKFSCRVCHSELEFNMKVSTTEITAAGNRTGKFCSTSGCHDGNASFGHTVADCEKCHNCNKSYH